MTTELPAIKVTDLTATINLNDNDEVYATRLPVQAHVRVTSPTGRNVDAFYIPGHSDNAMIENVAVETINSKSANAVGVRGKKAVLRNISQIGSGRALTFTGAQGMDADMIVASSGSASEYCMGAWDADPTLAGVGTNNDNTIHRFILYAGKGTPGTPGMNVAGCMHAARIEHSRNLVLGSTTLELPPAIKVGDGTLTVPQAPDKKGKRFAWFSRQDGWPSGCAMNIKEAEFPKLIHGWAQGPVAFNAGLPPDASSFPHWRVRSPYLSGCKIETWTYLAFGPGVIDAVVEDCVVRAIQKPTDWTQPLVTRGACLQLSGGLGAWPKSNGTMRRTLFEGAKLVDDSNIQHLANWSFYDCYFKGLDGSIRKLGLHGELL